MTVDRAIEVLKQCIGDCGDCITCAEHDEAIALAVKGLLVLRSANSLFAGSDALAIVQENKEKDFGPTIIIPDGKFGERIRACLICKNMTTGDLGNLLGVHPSVVFQYMQRGYTNGNDKIDIKKMADILECDVRWLLCGESEGEE